jgi:hypothetical protein
MKATDVSAAPDHVAARPSGDWCVVRSDPIAAGGRAEIHAPPVHTDIVARLLGGTNVWVRGTCIERWGTSRGLMIFRYLLLHDRPVPRDHLMDMLWPGSTSASARNNLNVAVYGLRRALEAGAPGPYVLFRDGAYQLAPDRSVWLDVRMFGDACARGVRAQRDGRLAQAERLLRDAVTLYGGPLFADDTEGEAPPRRTPVSRMRRHAGAGARRGSPPGYDAGARRGARARVSGSPSICPHLAAGLSIGGEAEPESGDQQPGGDPQQQCQPVRAQRPERRAVQRHRAHGVDQRRDRQDLGDVLHE